MHGSKFTEVHAYCRSFATHTPDNLFLYVWNEDFPGGMHQQAGEAFPCWRFDSRLQMKHLSWSETKKYLTSIQFLSSILTYFPSLFRVEHRIFKLGMDSFAPLFVSIEEDKSLVQTRVEMNPKFNGSLHRSPSIFANLKNHEIEFCSRNYQLNTHEFTRQKNLAFPVS